MPSIFLPSPIVATAQWYTVTYNASQGASGRLTGGTGAASVSVQAGSSQAALADVENQVGASGSGFSVKGPFATEPGGPSLTGTPGTPGAASPVYGAACYFVIPEGSAGQVTAALSQFSGTSLYDPVTNAEVWFKVINSLSKLGSKNNVMTASGAVENVSQQNAMKQVYGQCYPSASAATAAAEGTNTGTSSGSPQFGLSGLDYFTKNHILTRFLKVLVGGILIIAGVLKLTGTEQKLKTALPKVAKTAAGIGLIAA